MRRLDLIARRKVRAAFLAWRTMTCRAAMAFVWAASHLPTDRDAQDRAIVACLIGAALLVWMLS